MAQVLCVFITCFAASAWTGATEPAPQHSASSGSSFVDDTVALLQATAEVKKASAKDKKDISKSSLNKPTSHREYGVEACPSGETTFKHISLDFDVQTQPAKPVETKKEEPVEATEAMPSPQNVQTTTSYSLTSFWVELQILLAVFSAFFWFGMRAKKGSALRKRADSETSEAVRQTWTLLLDAALAADEASFEMALERVNEERMIKLDSWGCTALHFAAKGGSVQIVKRLLEQDLLVDSEDAWDETPLHIAARAGHIDVCDFLLSAGAKIDTLNAEDRTPLVVAGWAGHKRVCRFLLEKGAGTGGAHVDELPELVSEMLAAQRSQYEMLGTCM